MRAEMQAVGGSLAGEPIVEPDWEVKSRRRRGGGHLHVITIACAGPYITGWRRPRTLTDAPLAECGGADMLDQ